MVALGDILHKHAFALDVTKVQGGSGNYNRLELSLVDWQELCDPRYEVRVELVDPGGKRCVFTAYSLHDQARIRAEHRKIFEALGSGNYIVSGIDEPQFQLETWG